MAIANSVKSLMINFTERWYYKWQTQCLCG